jgi:2-polyprenyl-6-methoxyphenol hydroxylase-like FAD-dependent oxidoreductase
VVRILISGASIAGPVLAYWLTRHDFDVTVVERAPTLRKTGGHAVDDLFRPSMEISAKMGVLPRIEALATGTDTLTLYRKGRRPARIDLTKIVGAASDQHVEIMRDDLSEVYYEAGRQDVECLFGDSITAISPDGEVTFEHAAPRRFDVVVGADGLHSNVRRLIFGDEAGLSRFIGGYLAVVSAPKALSVDG